MKNDDRIRQTVEETYRQNRRERHKQDLFTLLSTVEGRRFLIDLLDECRVFRDNWTPSAEIHRFEGMRHIGLTILRDIEELGVRGLELYHIAQKEYAAIQQDENRRCGIDIARRIEEEKKHA